MSLDRTFPDSLVDDDGSNTVGSLWDKADVEQIYDDVDAEIARIDADIASSSATDSVTTSTSTGAQNDWVHGLGLNTGLVEWNGASDVAITGLKGQVIGSPVNQTGQRITFKNITTTKIATFAHQSGSSAAGNKLVNLVTSSVMPVAPKGWITYQYDGTDWRVVGYEQGALITPTYAGGDYTASSGTWTVDSGDISTMAYKLSGAQLTIWIRIASTSVSATPAALQRVIPGGFTATKAGEFQGFVQDNGVAADARPNISAGGTTLSIDKRSGNWATSTNNTSLYMTFTFEVT